MQLNFSYRSESGSLIVLLVMSPISRDATFMSLIVSKPAATYNDSRNNFVLMKYTHEKILLKRLMDDCIHDQRVLGSF